VNPPTPTRPQLNRRSFLALATAAAIDSALPLHAASQVDPDWTTPLPPFRIAGNIHYVGSRDLASYLITTSHGHILINTNLTTSPTQIRASIEKLGFTLPQVKILLISHAHNDHCAGSAELVKISGAKYAVMDGDVPVVESGGKQDFQYGNRPEMLYPAAKVARILHDGDQVQLGGAILTARKTAGHTKGCTTWTMQVEEGGKTLNAVIVGGPNVNPGYNLIHDPKYPQMAADYAQGFRTLKSLPCDVFLGAHGQFFNLLPKIARKQAGDPAAFFDPSGYRNYIANRQQAFETELARQQKGAQHPNPS